MTYLFHMKKLLLETKGVFVLDFKKNNFETKILYITEKAEN